MDIHRLLAPTDASEARDDSPLSTSTKSVTSPHESRFPPRPSYHQSISHPSTSSLSHEVTRSPRKRSSQSLTPQAPTSVPGFQLVEQTATLPHNTSVSPQTNTARSHYEYAQASQQRPAIVHRSSSRLTSASHTESSTELSHLRRSNVHRTDSANSVTSQSTYTLRNSPSLVHPGTSAPPNLRNLSNNSVAQVTMEEAPAQTPTPRAFTSNVLSEAELATVTGLLGYLGENSYAYDSHVELVKLLHKGLVRHAYPPADVNEATRDPRTYTLLSELRQAREAMDSRFAVGEAIWLEWLSDEVLLARSSEERLAVIELYQKAVQDEPSSVRIWLSYIDWVESNYSSCHDLEGADNTGWTEEDREICKELFTKDMLLNVLEEATAATQWRIDASHLLWNKHIHLAHPSPDSISHEESDRLQDAFARRLQIPHTAWDDTAQLFWPLISRFHGEKWEGVMSQVNNMAQSAKTQMGMREEHELKLQRAVETGDLNAIFDEFTRYIKWEKSHKRRSSFDKELRCALYARALLHFPAYTDWWLDYIDFVVSQQPSSHNPSSSLLPLIERATRHCPWSGELWARRIVRSDVERKPYHEIEATKHRATNSGLLAVGGMEELLKVLIEWCSYLRRHAFTSTSTEDDVDTAEVGMTMALEDVREAGQKLYGDKFEGDPLYRLEQIQIKFLSQARRFEDARAVYRSLVEKNKNSYDFWLKFYHWEISLWIHLRLNESQRVETTETGPHMATALVQEALSQKNLDWPEKTVELYVTHFQQHECVEKLQAATIEVREFSRRIAAKRAKETQQAAVAHVQVQAHDLAAATATDPSPGEKRKRQDLAPVPEEPAKKAKTDEAQTSEPAHDESANSASAQIKRDRENCTLTLKNLSSAVKELDVKKFFRDCGTIKSISILLDGDDKDTASATVEFELQEDVETAKIRNGKDLLGREVRIQSGSQSTLYVANYPSDYDETAIRNLFSAYGEIVSVRFPSLKYNNRRRFCYVQFLSAESARSAEQAMDGKMLDGLHRLLAKISDPDAKKQRSGAQAEGRELFVKNIENTASEAEVKNFFEDFGSVLSVNLLKNVGGRRMGTGFVVYATKEEATKTIEKANNKPFRDRILHVAPSMLKGGVAPADKAHKTDIIVKHSMSPEPNFNTANGDRRGSDVSMMSASNQQDTKADSWKTVRERQIAIFNVPDTVNDTRITAEMEKHGPVTKIQLRRHQNAAIIEFSDVKVAFDVRQGVDCTSLGPEARTGDTKELFAKGKKPSVGPALGEGSMKPSLVSRPGQRGGRRGGLGSKRGGLGSATTSGDSSQHNGTAARSNADFKAMFERSKKPAGPQ